VRRPYRTASGYFGGDKSTGFPLEGESAQRIPDAAPGLAWRRGHERRRCSAGHDRPLGTLTLLALAIGLPLTLLVDGGALQGVAVVALLSFLALASVTVGGAAAKAAASDD
jgi:hypothetical protein